MSSSKYFEVFKQPADHYKWSKQKEFAAVMEGIEENTRIEFISALDFLERELGKAFLKTINANHPIKQKISNKADWQIQELVRLANTLRKLKSSDSNYPKLIQKLLTKEKSKSEGIPFVEISENFLNENFQVYFPDETNTGKSPDIEIINPENNDRFFIEVSMVKNSNERDFISDNYNFLFHQFHLVPPIYLCTGKQKKIISREDYPIVKKIISEVKKKVEATNEIVTYSDECLEFSLAPVKKVEELDRICAQNGTRKNDVDGLPLNFDDTDRLINNKIKIEAKQIPTHSNGLVYFPVSPLFFVATDITTSIIRLQDYISRFTNLVGIVIYSKILNQQEEVFFEKEKNYFSRKMFGGVLCRELLFVCNHNCDIKITDATIQKIYSTFK